MTPNLRWSRHLRFLRRPGGTHLAYHRLFGNLRVCNDASLALLDRFESPVGPHDLAWLLPRYGPTLNAFYDMYYLVEDGVDERSEHGRELAQRAEQLSSGRFIGGLQLSVSDACNFACKYCFCDAVDARGQERQALSRRADKLMSFDTARRTIDTLIDNVRQSGKNSLVVKFFGREPLINWKLIGRIMEHYGRGQRHGVRVHYALTTNASLVSPEVARMLGRYQVRTTVSIDGLADGNDKVRVSKGAEKETFSLIHRGIRNLHRAGALHVLSAVITDDNFADFDGRFVDYARRYGVGEIQVLLGMQGEFIDKQRPEAIARKLFEVYAYGRQQGIAITGYWHNAVTEILSARRLRSDNKTSRGVVESCTATGHQISVEPSGDIFPCRAMSTHMGHISDFQGMLHSDRYKLVVMRTYGNVPECRGCDIEGFCQGECLGNVEDKYDDIYRVDSDYCEIYRRIHEKILRHFVVSNSFV